MFVEPSLGVELPFFSHLICQFVNKDWSEFNPSPFSTRYFSVPELGKLLQNNGFKVEFYGAFSTLPNGLKEEAIATIKRIAIALRLIPKTMKGKEFLKRIFFGKLIPSPPEITEGMAPYASPVEILVDKNLYGFQDNLRRREKLVPKAEVRSQRPEVRIQKSEIKGQGVELIS